MSPAVLSLFLACHPYQRQVGPVAFDQQAAPVDLVGRHVGGPVVWVEVAVQAGSAHDPPGREGLAWLAARAIREGGAGEADPEAVENLLYELGTDIEVVVDRELVTFRLPTLVEDLDRVAPLLGDMLIAPTLDETVVSRLEDEAADTLSRGLLESDEALGLAVFDNWIFAGHPYGHQPEGRASVAPTLTIDELLAFQADNYVRPAILLGVAGPMVTEGGELDPSAPGGAALVALRARLSEAPAGPVVHPTPRRVPDVDGRALLVVEKATASTGVHLGFPTDLDRASPDWPAMALAITALGEHRQSHGRLYRELRTERGLNYGDYAYLEIYRQAGWSPPQETGTGRRQNPFYIWLRPVSAENGPFALRAAVSLLEDFVSGGLEEEEFERIRGYLAGRVALWGADPGRRLGWAVEARSMAWPDPIDSLPGALADLDLATVNAAIQRHLDPSRLEIVVVTGDGAGFVSALKAPSPRVGEPFPDGDPRASQEAAWAEYDLGLTHSTVLPAEDLFR